ncbi:MAG: phosphatidylglycerophosphatase A [Rhizobiales bacterium]|nr:phosphatidylglycerophosphatase A [Hyphomicrobiales bacterium]
MSEPPRPDLRFLLSSPAAFLALGCGAGLVPRAPGTAGSLLAIPLTLLLKGLPFGWQIAIWATMCVAGIWLCDRVGRTLGEPDHPAIVWDEICGMAIVLLLSPPGLGWVLAGFLAFRVFDIVKPWPIHIIDRRLPNGLGAMGDDLMAAVYAAALVMTAQALWSTTPWA